MNRRVIALLSAGHMVADLYAGALPALLPVFQTAYGLSYSGVAVISSVSHLTSSVSQPLMGYVTDRVVRRGVLPLACIVAAIGISATGLAPSFGVLLLLVVLGGLGVAAYHPPGYKMAGHHAGARRATGTSFFSVGGNLGVAIGPLLATAAVLRFGLAGTALLVIPGLVMAAALAWLAPERRVARGGGEKADGRRQKAASAADDGSLPSADRLLPSRSQLPMRARVLPLVLLTAIVVVRSATSVAIPAFVPLYYVRELGSTVDVASRTLSLFLFAGAVGTLVGGYSADRWGRLRWLLVSQLVVAPALVVFLRAGGAVAAAALVVAGAALISSFGVTVVMAQELWPENQGMASGIMVGFAFGVGGLLMPLLGAVADTYGLATTLWSVTFFPLAAVALTGLLGASLAGLGPSRWAPAGSPVRPGAAKGS